MIVIIQVRAFSSNKLQLFSYTILEDYQKIFFHEREFSGYREKSSSSSRSSDGNSSLLDEGGSASQVPQASVQLAGYGSVAWPDSLSEWLVDGVGLQ